MKKQVTIAGLAMLMAAPVAVQAQLGSLLGGKKDKAASEQTDGSVDNTTIEGKYITKVGGPFGKGKVDVKHVREEDGVTCNKLLFEFQGNNYEMFEDKSLGKKLGMLTYKGTYGTYLIQMEPGVFAVIESYTPKFDGTDKISNVCAKDGSKIKDWDDETIGAKIAAGSKKASAAANSKTKEKLMGYPTYAHNVGKTVFASSYGIFNHGETDKPTDDESKFIKTYKLGESLFTAAYFDKTIGEVCGQDCLMDIEYEMEGVKTSREKLRRSSASWAYNIKKKDNKSNVYCINYGHQLWSPEENVMDYAFFKLIYDLQDKLKPGSQHKMTVRFFANRDGNNVEKLSEGTITISVEQNSLSKLSVPLGYIKQTMKGSGELEE